MKISQYTYQPAPDPLSYVVVAYKGQNYRVQLTRLLSAVRLNRSFLGGLRDDMLNITPISTGIVQHLIEGVYWTGNGTRTLLDSINNHPGITRIASTVVAGPSLRVTSVGSLSLPFRIYGSERFDLIWRPLLLSNDLFLKFGLLNNVTSPNPTITLGVYLDVNGSTISGKAVRSGSTSTTPTTYTLTVNTWYRAHMEISDDSSRVDYFLYAENGELLWTDSVSTDIPVVSDGGLQDYLFVYKNITGIVENWLDIDYYGLSSSKVLVR